MDKEQFLSDISKRFDDQYGSKRLERLLDYLGRPGAAVRSGINARLDNKNFTNSALDQLTKPSSTAPSGYDVASKIGDKYDIQNPAVLTALSVGAELADPLSFVDPAMPAVGAAGVIDRKMAEKILSQARKLDNPDYVERIYRAIKDKMGFDVFKKYNPSSDGKNIQKLSDIMTDLVGHRVMDIKNLPDEKNMVKHINRTYESLLGVPENRIKIIGESGEALQLSPQLRRDLGAGTPNKNARASYGLIKSEDGEYVPHSFSHFLNNMELENITPHNLTGLGTHEAQHHIEKQLQGKLSPKPYSMDVLDLEHPTLKTAYESSRSQHHNFADRPFEPELLSAIERGVDTDLLNSNAKILFPKIKDRLGR